MSACLLYLDFFSITAQVGVLYLGVKWGNNISKVYINMISSTKEMNPITRKSMPKLVRQPSFRAVGQTHAEW